eukprot:gene29852-27542_t
MLPPLACIACAAAAGCQVICLVAGRLPLHRISADDGVLNELRNRVVSTVHATTVSVLALWTVTGAALFEASALGELCAAVSVGMAYLMHNEPEAVWLTCLMLLTELTTPLLNNNWIIE